MVARKHDDATLIRALAQNSNAKAAALLDLDIRNVERHRSRLIRLGLLQPASAPVEMANATAETYVITAAVNATKVHLGIPQDAAAVLLAAWRPADRDPHALQEPDSPG